MQFLAAHWKDLVLGLLAIDVALVSIFPQVPLFVQIKDFLSKFAEK